MITLAAAETCTGCMACLQACPLSCIEIQKDRAGNIYPKIDPTKCISCGKCHRSCPAIHPVTSCSPQKAYAVWSLDERDRRSSASGGAASVFYQTALRMDAWICGTEYTNQFHVVHTLTKSPDAIAKYKQSKYVFSDSSEVYRSIQNHLKNKEKVLFISLPCKVAGLLRYLGKHYDNLITVDIVCHGTPSYDRLRWHIDHISTRHIPDRLSFRNENEFCFELTSGTKKIYRKVGRQDSYLAAFLEGIDYRPSCYQCPYACQTRISDLTICDFWGLGQEVPFNHPYTGAVSAVLVHTDAGRNFFEKCKPSLFWEERPIQEVLKGNAQLNYPTPAHAKSEQFDQICTEAGLDHAVSICLKDEISLDRQQLIRRTPRRILRKTAGLFLKRYRG